MDRSSPATSNNLTNLETDDSLAYPLIYRSVDPETGMKKRDQSPSEKDRKMVLKCKACRADFDSTFSIEEFSMLSRKQYEAGTLHLCPNCGNLSIYELKDYREP